MQYIMEILIALLVTLGFAILCTGVKRLCKKAICKKTERANARCSRTTYSYSADHCRYK